MSYSFRSVMFPSNSSITGKSRKYIQSWIFKWMSAATVSADSTADATAIASAVNKTYIFKIRMVVVSKKH